jgi:hypothetical protein
VQEITYIKGPRVLPNGINLDKDVAASHPVIYRRQIADPVTDGSLGEPQYEPGQKNLDGSSL